MSAVLVLFLKDFLEFHLPLGYETLYELLISFLGEVCWIGGEKESNCPAGYSID